MYRREASGALVLATLLALGAVMTAPLPARAQSKFSDLICPNATEPVREFEMQRRAQPPVVDHLISAAKKAIDAYDRCASTKLTEGEATVGLPNQTTQYSNDSGFERQHYANLRAAQYYMSIGRLHRLLERFDLARSSYRSALELAKKTVDWQSPGQVTYRSNNGNLGSGSVRKPSSSFSAYRNDAIAIRDAALAELARLPNLENVGAGTH